MGDLMAPMAYLFLKAIGVTLWLFYFVNHFLEKVCFLPRIIDIEDIERS